MHLKQASIRNFRRLENVDINFEESTTAFVGPNNSGKTSATRAFRLFLKRPNFSIHDFTVSCLEAFNACSLNDNPLVDLPSIELSLWFSIDSSKIEFGRVFALLQGLSSDLTEVGIQIRFSTKNPLALWEAYLEESNSKPILLSSYLSRQEILNKHFGLEYFSLQRGINEHINSRLLESETAKKVLGSLLKVDFVDAERNLFDEDDSKGTRLSTVFRTYFKLHLEEPISNENAVKVIQQSNENLTELYAESFRHLFEIIALLGIPSIHDRKLRLRSNIDPHEALKGSTDLLYLDSTLNHELPETHNGLGFKHLIYLALQISHYHIEWINSKESRPLCHLIFIEEPEVHLHAQAQQAFVANVTEILVATSKTLKAPELIPQLCITTHSSHVVDRLDFSQIRYFRRCHLARDEQTRAAGTNASLVKSLSYFQPNSGSPEEAVDFLKKYLRLTHCDLFFADAAILVEGSAEKLLLPEVINRYVPELNARYITILEIGGAYAQLFSDLLEFIGIPYLVVTDIDSIAQDSRLAVMPTIAESRTSNAAIRYFLELENVADLVSLQKDNQIVMNGQCFITYQKPIVVAVAETNMLLHGRTLEDQLIFSNLKLFGNNGHAFGIAIDLNWGEAETQLNVYNLVRNESFKKTEFALRLIGIDLRWEAPEYLLDGLTWLSSKLRLEDERRAILTFARKDLLRALDIRTQKGAGAHAIEAKTYRS